MACSSADSITTRGAPPAPPEEGDAAAAIAAAAEAAVVALAPALRPLLSAVSAATACEGLRTDGAVAGRPVTLVSLAAPGEGWLRKGDRDRTAAAAALPLPPGESAAAAKEAGMDEPVDN